MSSCPTPTSEGRVATAKIARVSQPAGEGLTNDIDIGGQGGCGPMDCQDLAQHIFHALQINQKLLTFDSAPAFFVGLA